jgi:hypothetical protein
MDPLRLGLIPLLANPGADSSLILPVPDSALIVPFVEKSKE